MANPCHMWYQSLNTPMASIANHSYQTTTPVCGSAFSAQRFRLRLQTYRRWHWDGAICRLWSTPPSFWWRYNAIEGKRIEVTTRVTQEVGSRAKTKLEASWSLVKCFVCLFVFSYHLETEHSKPHPKHKELLQKCGCGLREWTWPCALKINSVSHYLAEGLSGI